MLDFNTENSTDKEKEQKAYDDAPTIPIKDIMKEFIGNITIMGASMPGVELARRRGEFTEEVEIIYEGIKMLQVSLEEVSKASDTELKTMLKLHLELAIKKAAGTL